MADRKTIAAVQIRYWHLSLLLYREPMGKLITQYGQDRWGLHVGKLTLLLEKYWEDDSWETSTEEEEE